jgi:hypothetical protein
MAGIRRPRRELEGAPARGCLREFEQPFLHGKVPGIRRLPERLERPRETDRKWHAQRNADRNPNVQRDDAAAALLDSADRRLMAADTLGQLGLCDV